MTEQNRCSKCGKTFGSSERVARSRTALPGRARLGRGARIWSKNDSTFQSYPGQFVGYKT